MAPVAPPALTAEVPLHLEEHLEAATIDGSSVPDTVAADVEWGFDKLQPGWRSVAARGARAVEPVRTEDALRLPLTAANPHPSDSERLEGYIFVDLPDWRLEDWGYVEIRARASQGMRNMGLFFNYTEDDPQEDALPFFSFGGRGAGLVSDGTVQTYRLALDSRSRTWEGAWTHFGLWFNAVSQGGSPALGLLSIRVIPAEAEFADEAVGVRTIGPRAASDSAARPPRRRTLFTHAPGTISYDVRVPRDGRLDVGLGVLDHDAGVRFSVTLTPRGGEARTLLDENWDDPTDWAQRTVDLTAFEGEIVTLALSAEAERPGTVALWAAPTVSGSPAGERPNIIFYVIDSAGADYMSAYGYGRRTTPYLERLAAEGALFERAYSNSSFTRPSTVTFLTSLQHSVLGGLVNGRNPVPDEVPTMAEHFHSAGYQTALLTTNPNAGRISNLDRGVDIFRDTRVGEEAKSAAGLHDTFWKWREDYPGEPYFVHFQTTNVHVGHDPLPPPFSGLFISHEAKARLEELEERIDSLEIWGPEALRQIGADWTTYASGSRDSYDEAMAHQDHQIGRLVERLKAAGEWERTLLIIASDHGSAAGSQDWQTLMLDPVPEAYDFSQRGTPMLRSGVSGIPLIVVWPGRIAPGQRFSDPVSMIDVLPTVLDLADLAMPEVFQGQSLAPLLLGSEGWESRPVILDEFEVDRETGELGGRIEVIDGWWGASLEIGPKSDSEDPGDHRPAPLLLCDLWTDPLCVNSLHEERPGLVEKYTRLLEHQFRAHQDLARRFVRAEDSPLTPDQLETLRSLGYIQ